MTFAADVGVVPDINPIFGRNLRCNLFVDLKIVGETHESNP